MNYLIIGDIHGCYYTIKEMLDKHWDTQDENLIILGDLVNKGKNSMMVLKYLFDLQKEFGDQILILKGNNEVIFKDKYMEAYADKGIKKFEKHGLDKTKTLKWISKLPHFCEYDSFFVSHAGIAKKAEYPVEADNYDLLFNRKSLKNIGKTQFIGHIAVKEPTFDKKANAWYMDTGAGYGELLSAVKIKADASIIEFISIKVDQRDISNK